MKFISFSTVFSFIWGAVFLTLLYLLARELWRAKKLQIKTTAVPTVADKKQTHLQMTVAVLYHMIFIMLSYLLMRNDFGIVLGWSLISAAAYLIYWIVSRRKSYMPWSVYGCFVLGTIAEVVLNLTEVIPSDGGFFAGLGQAVYVFLIIIEAVVFGIANIILYTVNRYRGKI